MSYGHAVDGETGTVTLVAVCDKCLEPIMPISDTADWLNVTCEKCYRKALAIAKLEDQADISMAV